MPYSTHIVTASSLYPLRSAILRNQAADMDCPFDGDWDTQTRHFAIDCDDKIVAIASLYSRSLKQLTTIAPRRKHWQLRSLATAPQHRNQGLASTLLQSAEQYAASNHDSCIWANIRVVQRNFYQKRHYTFLDPCFNTPSIGWHQCAYKLL